MPAVVHHPRLAWDGARALVHGAQFDVMYGWLVRRLDEVLPPESVDEFMDTRERLLRSARDDAESIEAARWRVHLEELLRARPGLAARLQAVVHDATTMLADTYRLPRRLR